MQKVVFLNIIRILARSQNENQIYDLIYRNQYRSVNWLKDFSHQCFRQKKRKRKPLRYSNFTFHVSVWKH